MRILYKPLIVAICFFEPIICVSQTMVVDYTLYMKNFEVFKDTLKNVERDNSIYEMVNLDVLSAINYRLIHSSGKSIFLCSKDVPIFKNIDEEDLFFLSEYKISDYTSVIFKDFKNRILLDREYILDKPFIIEDILSEYSWQITNQENIINGIKCNLAKSKDIFGYNIDAWYSIDFPISNGPSIYHDLPGLIVEIDSEEFRFSLNSVKIINTNTPIMFNEKGTKINHKDFVDLLNKKMKQINLKK